MSILGYRCDNIKDNVNVFKGGRNRMKEAKKLRQVILESKII